VKSLKEERLEEFLNKIEGVLDDMNSLESLQRKEREVAM
jgi:hypothetical protein